MKDTKLHTWKKATAKLLMALMLVMSVVVLTPAVADAATKPAFTKTTRTILQGKKYTLSIKNKIKKSSYTWTTSNKKIAKVNKKGVVTAVKKGTATITCKVRVHKKSYTLKCKVSVIKPAEVVKITNKVAMLNVGQTYDLDCALSPLSSNDKTTWTTSDATIAAPDKDGKFTALKAGTVVITVTTMSGANDSVKIVVADKDAISNQSQLDAVLASNATSITIKTTDAVNLTIAAGDYSTKSLVVDAPNADITNNGKFASIEIKQIKASTWYENAIGNLLKVLAANSRVVVGKNASASIEVNQESATLTIVNNGEIKKVTVSKKATVDISGASTANVPVVVDVPGVKITTSVPLNLQCNAKAELVVNKGAEATKIQASTESAIPTIIGTGSFVVTIGTGATATTKTVDAVPANTNSNGTSYTGGGNGGGPSTTALTFDTAISKVTAISVNYGNNQTYSVDGDMLSAIKVALAQDKAATAWSLLGSKTYNIAGKVVKIDGKVGENTKKVIIGTKTYTVTANNNNSFTITNASNVSVTLTKSLDDRNFTITTTNTLESSASSQTAAKVLNYLNSVSVTYNGKSYTVPCPELATVQKYINLEPLAYATWTDIEKKTKDIDGQTVTITGTKGSNAKTVTVAGKTFNVTMNSNNSVIVTYSSNLTYFTATMIKGTNSITVTLN